MLFEIAKQEDARLGRVTLQSEPQLGERSKNVREKTNDLEKSK